MRRPSDRLRRFGACPRAMDVEEGRGEAMLNDILIPADSGYRPDFDGTLFDGSQVHLDLNKPVSGPSHAFMALGGTPPSATHVPGGLWEVPLMAPARVPTPPAARGRARRAPRRRGCDTGGHM
ncbi:hypothetical protein PIB30_002047 [Stylosanthes scabra]|uniref:Uncharacterized protein n=1 Tax=Stylosanthes scabra TaxID=79078 RepID=A0ABU6Q2S3_9FABA|nr:hypothetical protein [Stylosanthes scabra]